MVNNSIELDPFRPKKGQQSYRRAGIEGYNDKWGFFLDRRNRLRRQKIGNQEHAAIVPEGRAQPVTSLGGKGERAAVSARENRDSRRSRGREAACKRRVFARSKNPQKNERRIKVAPTLVETAGKSGWSTGYKRGRGGLMYKLKGGGGGGVLKDSFRCAAARTTNSSFFRQENAGCDLLDLLTTKGLR